MIQNSQHNIEEEEEWTLSGFKAGKLWQSKRHGVGKRIDKWISETEYSLDSSVHTEFLFIPQTPNPGMVWGMESLEVNT